MRGHYIKLREGREKLAIDIKKNLTYRSGMMGPGGTNNNKPPSVKERNNDQCSRCGLDAHQQMTSILLCPKSLQNLGKKQKKGKSESDQRERLSHDNDEKEIGYESEISEPAGGSKKGTTNNNKPAGQKRRTKVHAHSAVSILTGDSQANYVPRIHKMWEKVHAWLGE
jgi:hypothetical protein